MKTVNRIFNSPARGDARAQHVNKRVSSMNLSSTRKYYSRKFVSSISWSELPLERDAQGINTPAGIFFLIMRLLCPLAYIYIFLILLRELSISFPNTIHYFLQTYIPPLASIIHKMQKNSAFAEIWVVIEFLFCILQILHIRYLQYKDPLEASLSAAPIATLQERFKLMSQVIEQVMGDDPVLFIRGWFFDEKLDDITRYDVMDFVTWSMFEGRHQEHLTEAEVQQLNWFVKEFECCIGVYLYGEKEDEDEEDDMDDMDDYGLCAPSFNSSDGITTTIRQEMKHLRPQKDFQFQETTHDTTPALFTTLYENYNEGYKQYMKLKEMRSVQNIRNFVANRRQQLVEAEEHAIAAASDMYEHAYYMFIDKGSSIDKQLNAISTKTHQQINDAWNSVGKITENLETAKFISKRKKFLQQQNKGYRMLLDNIIHSQNSVPVPQMVDLMKKITQCNESLETIENSAMDSFFKVTGFAKKHLLQKKEPQRYAKYTSDELLGLAIYPLAFNLAILGLTDGLLRVTLAKRGFQRLNIGNTIYYFHPGKTKSWDSSDHDENDHGESEDEPPVTPIVFCHGIGIGLGYYLTLIDELLKMGRPLFMPEIPYVCGFRPWISRKSYLSPPTVVSTLTAMLASHGYMKASFVGHSYGTSWVSYMCKYASHTIASIFFVDPICFCLHHPCLTKSFVYHRADPGSISYFVKTDVIVNWTIQRSFPWARISLFIEDIPNVPCSVYISDNDNLIPVEIVLNYFRRKGAHFCDEGCATSEFSTKGEMNVTILKGQGHGDWTERPSTCANIATTAKILTEQYESKFTT